MSQSYQAPALLVGRVLLALMFVMSGFSKISGFSGTQQYMEAFGVPGILLPLVIIAEIGLGLAIIVGFKTRLAALGLAGFTLVAGAIFHNNFADQMQMIMFMKNLSITGAFLVLSAIGAGAWSLDARNGAAAEANAPA